ncbi:MAG TPA: GGDEF domain-containing protein [Terriglobia bacterium]|nr:GGDEF domain-containing protein [Terriglobia bacterium]
MNERLIELGLFDEDGPEIDQNASVELASFVARLLALVSNTTIESDTLKTYEFRSKLERYRHRLANSVHGDPNTALVADDCFRLCKDYLKRSHSYLLERETEFADVIDLMRIALSKIAGEAKTFSARLMGSSERFNRLTEIEDIRELKKQIAQEVRELNRTVTEKQKQDEVNYARLSRRIEVLQTNLARTSEEATIDPLTRVSNRGSFDRAYEEWIATHKENRKTFILAMLDLDNFKQINDAHGHQVGDRVLLSAAQWFGKYLRTGDFLGRYGGEEFAILMTDADLTQAEARFTELLSRIAACSFEYNKDGQGYELYFTVSCGLAEFSFDETAEDLLRRADEALYEAKRTGKNRVVIAKKPKSLWTALKPFVPFRDAK